MTDYGHQEQEQIHQNPDSDISSGKLHKVINDTYIQTENDDSVRMF